MSNNSQETNSYVFDPESPTEMARLINQDHFTTKNMGGSFVGLTVSDISGLHDVVDLGCGPGGWALEAAFEHPDITVTGIDISQVMINYANARARTQQRPNASFRVMDITGVLNFLDESFDMVNARLLFAVLRRDAWAPFIKECTRILRPGGILRLAEPADLGITTSPALEQLNTFLRLALWRAGYGFSPDGQTIGVTGMLPRLLRNAGYQNIRYHAYVDPLSAEEENWNDYFHNVEIVFQTIQPLLIKTGVTTQEEVQHLYQQMLIEVQQNDFCGIAHGLAVMGYKA